MAHGRSLTMAKIQPPLPRMVHNSSNLGAYARPETYSKRVGELRGYKERADAKRAESERKLKARNEARKAIGLEPFDSIGGPKWSIDYYLLARSDAVQEKTLRTRKRWWRTNFARVGRMFGWLGEVSQ